MFSPVLIISIQPKGRLWQEPEPSQVTGMALAHCVLGSFLGVGCHCFPPPLDIPTFASRCLHVQVTWETSISERWNYGREMAGQFCLWFRLPRKPRVLWHAAQICDMGDGFTSPPKEGMLWIFFAQKIRRLQPGSNPRSWVPEASMLTTRPLKPPCCSNMTKKMCSNLKALTVIHIHIPNTFCESVYLLALIFNYCRQKSMHYIMVICFFLFH